MPEGNDTRDPLRAAFDDYRRAPRDIVPKRPWPVDNNADLDALAGETVEFVHYENAVDGVRRHTQNVIVTKAIIPGKELN